MRLSAAASARPCVASDIMLHTRLQPAGHAPTDTRTNVICSSVRLNRLANDVQARGHLRCKWLARQGAWRPVVQPVRVRRGSALVFHYDLPEGRRSIGVEVQRPLRPRSAVRAKSRREWQGVRRRLGGLSRRHIRPLVHAVHVPTADVRLRTAAALEFSSVGLYWQLRTERTCTHAGADDGSKQVRIRLFAPDCR